MRITNGKCALEITHVPDRKKPVLLIGSLYCGHVVATFTNENDASEFELFLQEFLGITKEVTE